MSKQNLDKIREKGMFGDRAKEISRTSNIRRSFTNRGVQYKKIYEILNLFIAEATEKDCPMINLSRPLEMFRDEHIKVEILE